MSRVRGVCKARGCSKPHHAQGYCSRHYQVLRRTGALVPLDDIGLGANTPPAGGICYVCDRPLVVHGLTEFCDLIDRRMAI